MRGTPRRPEGATIEEPMATEHAAIREHLGHVRALADDAQHGVPLRLRWESANARDRRRRL